MTALTDALEHPNIRRVFLVEVTAGQRLTFWTLNAGTTWWASTTLEVSGVEENGVALTSRASIALVDANPGSYYFDAAAQRVYVHCTGGSSPYTKTLQAQVAFWFANHPKIFNGHYYEPRLDTVPNVSMRIERKFTGISQIGGGVLGMLNQDGYFDSLVDLQWDAGLVVVAFGVDRPGISEMGYADYAIIGTWKVTSIEKSDERFILRLAERKASVNKKIPTTIFTRSSYPNLREQDVGKTVPLAYGVIKDIEPVCIDLAARKFKVAGHAITGFDAVRVKNQTTGVWETKGFATTDTTLAEFTMSSGDWADGKEIAVDFRGKPTAGIVMDNASDIVMDILTVVLGEPTANINTSSFTSARDKLDAGAVFNSANRATIGKIAVYVDEAMEARSILELINLAVNSHLLSDSDGKYYYRLFEPVVGEGLTTLTDTEIENFSETDDSEKIYSKVLIRYNRRNVQDWAESYEYLVDERKYLHNQNEAALLEQDAVLSETGDAKRLGQRLGIYEGRPARVWKLTTRGRLMLTKLPGDHIRITYSRHSFDEVVEILELNHDLLGDKTTLTVTDLRGHGDESGFWVSDAATLPARFSTLAGYGAGSLTWNKNWHPDIKKWARQNVGYWTDDNGFADPTDPDSFIPSSWT